MEEEINMKEESNNVWLNIYAYIKIYEESWRKNKERMGKEQIKNIERTLGQKGKNGRFSFFSTSRAHNLN